MIIYAVTLDKKDVEQMKYNQLIHFDIIPITLQSTPFLLIIKLLY